MLNNLRRALRAIATGVDSKKDGEDLLTQLKALVEAFGFFPAELRKLAELLRPEVDSAMHVAGMPPASFASLDDCIAAIVACERSTRSCPGHVYDVLVDGIAKLVPAKQVPTARLFALIMRDAVCPITSYATLCMAIDRLNDFALHPKEVTAERYAQLIAAPTSATAVALVNALPDDQLRALMLHAGAEMLCSCVGVNDRAARRRFRDVADAIIARARVCDAGEPVAKMQRTE